MAVMVDRESALDALARLEADVTALQQVSLTPCVDDEITEFWRRLEAVRRRITTLDHDIVMQIKERNLAFRHGCRSVAAFARHLLRIAPGEATARVRAAGALGVQRTITGDTVPAVYPTVAAAQKDGAISDRHARVIVQTVEHLPDEVRARADRTVEQLLTDFAREHDPERLATYARDIAQALDQDGQYRDLENAERRRGITLIRQPDGSARIDGVVTPELHEHLLVHFDALAGPRPAVEGVRDPRTPAQRRHDALLAALALVERAGQLPTTAGMSATIVVTMDAEAFGTGRGTATTGHGYTLPADVAKRWAGQEARVMAVLLSQAGRVEACSGTRRLFTEQQRLALLARDKGCSFPGCDAPPGWTEIHHVVEYADGGPTSIDNGTMLCRFDHAHHLAMGWRCTIVDGAVWWIPPAWLDHARTPRRNTVHDRG